MLKRMMVLLTFFTVASMLLAACGTDTAPAATAIPAVPTTAPVPPTAAPAATNTAMAAAPTTAPANTAAPGATTGAGTGSGTGNVQVIWFAWQPCQALTDLSKKFPGGNVDVRCVPIAQWHDQIFNDFAAKGGADVVILDSQFIGEAVKGGHVVDLTDWMKTNIDVADYVPAALAAYGEYPAGSGKYYGVAAEGDTQMLVYRKDLFADATFQADYKAKTGKDLAVPKTWNDVQAVAQFVKDSNGKYKAIKNGYTTHWCGTPACYDQMATHWNQILWSLGGDIWDPKTYKAQGFINSDLAVKALDFDRKLFQTGPEGQGNFQFNETVDSICSGTTAMATIWFGFGAAFVDSKGCKNSANLGYAAGPAGDTAYFLSLGGMGVHVSTYTKNKDAALAYVKWFESKDTQLAWAGLGGFSARKSVLASDTFKNAAPYNPAFADAYQHVKDFWNIPEYNTMLQVEMEQLNLAVTGQATSKDALDAIAKKQQQILDEAYPNGPPK